jgi:hypothetical protein
MLAVFLWLERHGERRKTEKIFLHFLVLWPAYLGQYATVTQSEEFTVYSLGGHDPCSTTTIINTYPNAAEAVAVIHTRLQIANLISLAVAANGHLSRLRPLRRGI